MMKKSLLLLLAAITITACDDIDNKNKHEISNASIDNHPLKAYFVPHGGPTLDYFGKFWRSCDPTKWISKEICDEEVKRAIEIGQKRGIKLKRDDLVNRNYWKKHLDIYKTKKKLDLEYRSKLPKGINGLEKSNKYKKDFRDKEYKLLQSIGGG